MTPFAETVESRVPADAAAALRIVCSVQTDLELFAEMLRRPEPVIAAGAMVYLAAMHVALERCLPSLRRH